MRDSNPKLTRIDPGSVPLGLALVPLLVLIFFLAAAVYMFGDDATSGASQTALFLAGLVTVAMAARQGLAYVNLEEHVVHSVSFVAQSIFILLGVGALIGTWILAGIVPALIVYGLELLSPEVFLFSAALCCALVSVISGSSWSTAGTLGLAFMGIGTTLGIPDAMTAGAVISGAYFGDKLSPFSETTNLAASMTRTDLFVHIRFMLYTTGPSFIIALLLFLVIGLTGSAGGDYQSSRVALVQSGLKDLFFIHPVLLLPIPFLFYLIYRKTPAVPAIFIAAITGGVLAGIFQAGQVDRLAGGYTGVVASLKAFFYAAGSGFSVQTDSPVLNSLLNRGGMSSMLNTVWIILAAMFFSGAMEGSGFLARIAAAILHYAKTAGRLVISTAATAVFMNATASEQYLSIVVTGRMYDTAYAKFKLAPQNLSRVLEDAGTLSSPLVPWNTCGAYMAATLGVPTWSYLPFVFFNLINLVLSVALGVLGIGLKPLSPKGSFPGRRP